MPQPEPTGGLSTVYPPAPVNSALNQSDDEPPPYGLTDPHPEYKAAFGNQGIVFQDL